MLGHRVSSKGIEVDLAKIATIEKLPPPKNVKGIRSFLGHAGFYRRFIRDFSKLSKPLCNLLEKNSAFDFDDVCLQAFNAIKEKLIWRFDIRKELKIQLLTISLGWSKRK